MNRVNQSTNSITLLEWLSATSYTEDDLHTLFVNMDSAMKYIHEKGFCIGSFNPTKVEILDDSLQKIKFDSLIPMDTDSYVVKKEYVREDIGRSALLQIGIYSNCLQYLNPTFLKENFKQFETFLPEGDIPYYKGVIERNASVYFVDYTVERRKRDLEALEREVNGNSNSNETTGVGINKARVYSNGHSILNTYDSTNSKINDSIYKNLKGMSDTAYISFLVVPFIVGILGFIFTLLGLLAK